MRTLRTVMTILAGIMMLAGASFAAAEEPALWLRYPAISPDGETIAFSYRGDLYTVPAAGGTATPLTLHEAHDTHPVWSPDGASIAFASDRYGQFDVFVMPATGGNAVQLTFHSADDTPTSFTPDGGAVLFASARLDARECVQFPTGAQPELYRVSVSGGLPAQVLTTPALDAVYDRSGSRLAYTDRKGYEMFWRKHDDSSFTRDVWVLDVASGEHSRLTAAGVDDRQPVWSPDESALYYLSERSGSFNVWKLDLADPSAAQQVTRHERHPVRFLSASRRGDLCYAFDGEIWTRAAGTTESRKLEIFVATDGRYNDYRRVDAGSQITEFHPSPDGSELAFIARGEVFVTSVDHGTTRRITDTPEQERSVRFSPDGRSLVYAGERDGSWNLYLAKMTDEDEPNFFNATALKEEVLLASDEETFQPRFSPDGKEIAFLENRTTLKVIHLESREVREIQSGERSYSYADGDQWYAWSPDGRWFLTQILSPERYSTEVALVPASGDGEPVNLTRSGYLDMRPRWLPEGAGMYWASDRHGARMQAGWPAEFDVYAAFFTAGAWDRFHLSPAEFEQWKAKKEKDEQEKKKKDDEAKDGEAKDEEAKDEEAPEPIEIELDGLEDRQVRLTLHSADMADARVTPDGETLLYLAAFEKGYDLWKYEHRKKEIKQLAKLGADDAGSLFVDKEGKKAFLLADRRLVSVDLGSGSVTPVALQAKVRLDAAAEREYLFEHIWRQTREKFYVEDLHGVDWDFYKTAYRRFLPHIDNNHDFAELVSELQGELNASHTGGRYRPRREDATQTASFAFFPDPDHRGAGIRILEIIEGSPLEQAERAVEPGFVIEAIDGNAIEAGENWYPLLDHKAGDLVRLTLRDPKAGETWEEAFKPVAQGQLARLLYERWVRGRRAEVERLSGGRLGYAHILGMSDGPYRAIIEDIFGEAVGKEGLVLDTRFNGGGNLVEPLTVFLSGEKYFEMVPRGRNVGINPRYRWTKPSIVVMNEGNYSDAHCFPVAYTSLGIGETVGMQVPGTCTSVWWERLQDPELIFGIPQIAHIDNEGDITENKHLDPDHEVDNDPKLEARGRDQQLEKAVEVLLHQLAH